MARIASRLHLGVAAAGLALSVSACTVHKTEVPAMTGPSGLGTNITITVSPDVLTQDGLSQSLVTITAIDNTGQPARNVTFRVDIAVGGVVADFGRLSAKNLVTDAAGHATLTYTAPPAPVVVVGNGTKVDIEVTPINGNFDNNNPRVASIMLVPPGIVIASSTLVPDFTAPSPGAGDAAVFSGTVSDPSSSGAVPVQFSWNFGDGGSATGQTVTHTFSTAGTKLVTLTITDNLGRTASVTKSVTVGAPVGLTATFFTTPASPVSGQSIIFNASQTQPPAGHTISEFRWDFGDGTDNAFGPVVNHTFTTPGTYTVLLRVTLDNGAAATASQTMTIAVPTPTARLTVLPASGSPTTTFTFSGAQSTAAPGRRIVTYTFDFGDTTPPVSGPSSTTTHQYGRIGTFTVTLIVTDDQGNQGISTPVTVTIS